MTENEVMGPKEVKNSEKKNSDLFFVFFFPFEIFLIAFFSHSNMDH